MTNAEKYLKDNVSVEKFAVGLARYFRIHNTDTRTYLDIINGYLNKKAKPTLTEDERVILRNLKQFNVIGRGADFIYVSLAESPTYKSERTYIPFAGLFQFIKERRRILNTRIIRR